MKKLHILLILSATVYACTKLEPQAPAAEDVMDAPLDGLSYTQYQMFNKGAEEFDETYTSENGLGPYYVATSCAACHSADNRGHFFTVLTRFGQTDSTGNHFMESGGPQLQNNALPGFVPELLPAGATSSKFIAPIVSGSGFIELVSDADIIAMAEENKTNTDGVRGHPNWNEIPDYVTPFSNAIIRDGKYICRFGRKASTYNLHQQTVQAFNQDMGITTTFLPFNPINYSEGTDPVPVADPEITDASVNANVFYLQTLQTPLQRNADDAQVIQGSNIFKAIGCEACHRETLRTGYSPVEALSNKEFHPYTDLLLHDMGTDLDDGYTEGTAKTSEWRTTPLWGLGLARNAQGNNLFLLHDGRAHSIDEAIQYHNGEALMIKNRYNDLSQEDKDAVIKFLNSL